MPDALQTYVISNDVPSGKVDADRLTQEIRASDIQTALKGINVLGNNLQVFFKADITAGDKTVLDNNQSGPAGGLIGAHSGEPVENPVTSKGIPKVHIDSPIVEGDTPVMASNTWPLTHEVVWCGEGDDVDSGAIGGGEAFRLEGLSLGDTSVELQFVAPIRLGGGHVFWRNCVFGDHASFLVFAPPTSNIVNNPGAGAYAKLPLGPGMNMLVTPGVPGSDGPNWNVDLAEKLNENVDFTKAVPVPAPDGDGFFSYDVDSGELTYTPGVGTHNLFDFEVPLSMFIRKIPLMGDSDMELTVYDNVPACVIPQWRSRVTLHREAGEGDSRKLVWAILLSRAKTV